MTNKLLPHDKNDCIKESIIKPTDQYIPIIQQKRNIDNKIQVITPSNNRLSPRRSK